MSWGIDVFHLFFEPSGFECLLSWRKWWFGSLRRCPLKAKLEPIIFEIILKNSFQVSNGLTRFLEKKKKEKWVVRVGYTSLLISGKF